MSEETQAVMPITEALPELRAEEYADVCEWDESRMRLAIHFEERDGDYLRLIRDKLAPAGLFGAYLKARSVPMTTAQYRIAKAEGRPYNYQPVSNLETARLPESEATPTSETVTLPAEEYYDEKRELARYRKVGMSIGYYGETLDGYDDSMAAGVPPRANDDGEDDEDDERPAFINRAPDAMPETPDEIGPSLGHYESDAWHAMAQAVGEAPETRGAPFTRYVARLGEYRRLPDDALDAWLEIADEQEMDLCEQDLKRVAEWCARVGQTIAARRRGGLRVIRATGG